MKKNLRSWFAGGLIVLLIVALLLPSLPLLSGNSSSSGATGPSTLTKLLKRIDPNLRAYATTADGAVVSELAFSFDPSTGAIGGYNLSFLTGGSGAWRAFTFLGRSDGTSLNDTNQESLPASPTRNAIMLEKGVLLKDAATIIDRIGLRNLLAPGALSIAQLVVSHDAGTVLTSDADREVLIVSQGKARSLPVGESTLVTGRVALLEVWRSGATPDGTYRERTYVLQDLCGSVTSITVPAPTLDSGETLLATHRADLDGDGTAEFVFLTGKGSTADGEYTAPRQRYLRLMPEGGQAGAAIAVPGSPSVYGAQVELRDLTGDGRLELLVQESLTDGSGTVDLNVFSLADGTLRPLFRAADQHRPAGLTSEYLTGGKVRTTLPQPKHVWEYTYLLDQVGNDEAQAKSRFVADWVEPMQDYDFADVNGDGRPEIIGRQSICGTAQSDVIAELRQIFVFDGTRFVRSDAELYTGFDLNLVQPKE